MRTFSSWVLLAIGLCCGARALAEPAAEPDEELELAGSEDALEQSPPIDEVATDDAVAGQSEAATPTVETDAETDAEATPADEDAEAPGCFGEPVAVRRFGESGELMLRLTDCKGEPNLAALSSLSALAQPLAAADALPSSDASVKLLNPQLLVRVQRLVEHFPGGGVEIVSGYRPHARPGSRHHSGDALDLHIDGVDNFELSEFARTLDATGVGYYPNSTFVHIDVRDAQAYWIDRSGPGERANYDRKAAAAVLAEDAVKAAASKEGDTPSAAESASEPDTASDADANADSATADADLQALAERALLVMNQALGLDDAHGAT